ncbi:hypothetical protein [Agromyces silvae]|nr:hypothetical protein [Agromyces protaetiae]
MFTTLFLFGAVALCGVGATVFQLPRDGHRRVPTRRYRTLP